MRAGNSTILFSGMLAGDPHQGGATWAVLQYLLGFRRLRHDVLFVEPIKPGGLRPAGAALADSASAAYFRQVARDFGLEGRAALALDGTRDTVGLPYPELRAAAGRADVLVNVSGMLADPDLTARVPVRVYLDLDPAFVQVWHAQGIDMRFDGHTHFVTVGQAVGRPDCPVPTCGRDWITTLPPVVLSEWPPGDAVAHDGLTTVANWRGYGSVEHQGVFYGQKAHSLRRFIDLPTRTPERFLPALTIHPGEAKDLEALAANGWRLLDPAAVAGSPGAYREFVRGSKTEFGVAKAGYLASRCGWFSDRSACYLAAGRPVIAQDTGFGKALPAGEGLFAFATAGDALAAIDEMNRDYPRHRRAARARARHRRVPGRPPGGAGGPRGPAGGHRPAAAVRVPDQLPGGGGGRRPGRRHHPAAGPQGLEVGRPHAGGPAGQAGLPARPGPGSRSVPVGPAARPGRPPGLLRGRVRPGGRPALAAPGAGGRARAVPGRGGGGVGGGGPVGGPAGRPAAGV